MKERYIFRLALPLVVLFGLLGFGIKSFYKKEKIVYDLTSEMIDVVIPSVEKDLSTLDLAIQGIRENGINVRRVIVISDKRLSYLAEWFPEEKFPFSKQDVARMLCKNDERLTDAYLQNPRNRIGWIYQQLLKLYAPFVIPGLSNNILVLDSDTIFMRPTAFQDVDGAPFFNPAYEYCPSYFIHAKKLIPGFQKVYRRYSGIAHHMLFQRVVLEDLFMTVEQIHGQPFWRVFCNLIAPENIFGSGASEYEIYFNFFMMRSDQYKIRKLRWINGRLYKLPIYRKQNFDYVSCHAHMNLPA